MIKKYINEKINQRKLRLNKKKKIVPLGTCDNTNSCRKGTAKTKTVPPGTCENKNSCIREPAKQNFVPLTKKTEKAKCVSNDRSHHDDQNACRIIKIGAILKG